MPAVWTRSAWKELQDLPKAKQTIVIKAVSRFAADPFGQHPNAKPLQDEKNAVRLRVGDYRVILHRGTDTIEVRAVVHRRQALRLEPTMRNAARNDRHIVVVPFDPRKGRSAVERLARTAAKLRDSGEADHVALPVDGAAAMAEILEDVEDAWLYRARAGEPTIPHGVVEAIHKGVHPVRAWRTHRGLTLRQLAEASGAPPGYLSEIETGKKPGSVAAYKSLARALGTAIDMLIAE